MGLGIDDLQKVIGNQQQEALLRDQRTRDVLNTQEQVAGQAHKDRMAEIKAASDELKYQAALAKLDADYQKALEVEQERTRRAEGQSASKENIAAGQIEGRKVVAGMQQEGQTGRMKLQQAGATERTQLQIANRKQSIKDYAYQQWIDENPEGKAVDFQRYWNENSRPIMRVENKATVKQALDILFKNREAQDWPAEVQAEQLSLILEGLGIEDWEAYAKEIAYEDPNYRWYKPWTYFDEKATVMQIGPKAGSSGTMPTAKPADVNNDPLGIR